MQIFSKETSDKKKSDDKVTPSSPTTPFTPSFFFSDDSSRGSERDHSTPSSIDPSTPSDSTPLSPAQERVKLLENKIKEDGKNIEALRELGLYFKYGADGVPKNVVEAAKLFYRAAQQRADWDPTQHHPEWDSEAAAELGLCFLRGQGVKKSDLEAVKCLKDAYKLKGNLRAAGILGAFYLDRGDESDKIRASQLLHLGANGGDPIATLALARSFFSGKLIPSNSSDPKELAISLAKSVVEQMQTPKHNLDPRTTSILATAQADLAYYYYITASLTAQEGDWNRKEAMALYKSAAATGNAKAQTGLGICYFYGVEGEKDYTKAAQLFYLAACKDEPVAQKELARCYSEGYGVEIDTGKAKKIYEYLATQKADPTAAFFLAQIAIKELKSRHTRDVLVHTGSPIYAHPPQSTPAHIIKSTPISSASSSSSEVSSSSPTL